MQSIVASNLRAMLGHPLTGLRACLGTSLLRQRLPCCKLLLSRAKQQEIFHRVLLSFLGTSLERTFSIPSLFIRRTSVIRKGHTSSKEMGSHVKLPPLLLCPCLYMVEYGEQKEDKEVEIPGRMPAEIGTALWVGTRSLQHGVFFLFLLATLLSVGLKILYPMAVFLLASARGEAPRRERRCARNTASMRVSHAVDDYRRELARAQTSHNP